MAKADLDALADEVLARKPSKTCWRVGLEGDAKRLVELVEERSKDALPPRAGLSRALRSLGLEVSAGVIAKHYAGGCVCRSR